MDKRAKATNSLPILTDKMVQALREKKPDFAYLYMHLQQTDPRAAMWLRDETEYLAPANPAEKEKYAILALKLHYMLHQAATQ